MLLLGMVAFGLVLALLAVVAVVAVAEPFDW
jgi:hypothetical protein